MLELLVQQIMASLAAPKADIEKNIRALLAESIAPMNLVSREEMDRQAQQLHHAQQQLATLKAQVESLVSQASNPA